MSNHTTESHQPLSRVSIEPTDNIAHLSTDDVAEPQADSIEGHRFQDDLTKSLYLDLRKVAHKRLRQLPSQTLNTTALINEAWPRLRNQVWHDRGHFVGAAGRAMRLVLIDYLRKQSAKKRPNPRDRMDLKVTLPGDNRARNLADVLAVHEALDKLAQGHPVAAKVVEARFFLGFTVNEISANLRLSRSTIEKKWTFARAWLSRALKPENTAQSR